MDTQQLVIISLQAQIDYLKLRLEVAETFIENFDDYTLAVLMRKRDITDE